MSSVSVWLDVDTVRQWPRVFAELMVMRMSSIWFESRNEAELIERSKKYVDYDDDDLFADEDDVMMMLASGYARRGMQISNAY